MTHSPDDRFGMPESAFQAARESHGLDNPVIRMGMYVPTREEVDTPYRRALCGRDRLDVGKSVRIDPG